MGIEYKHYLIPEDNTHKPRPEKLSKLVSALLKGGFVAEAGTDAFGRMTFETSTTYEHAERTGCYAHLGDRTYSSFPCPCSEEDIAALGEKDFKLVWPVESTNESGLKYPLSPFPGWGDAYYELQLHVATDFVYHLSERIDPFVEVACKCGRSLEYYDESATMAAYPVYYDGRIHRACPTCGSAFRPQELVAKVRDGWTGEATSRSGGATYLFAVVIDCGKGFARDGFAREGSPIRTSEEFIDTVRTALDQELYEIGDFY